MSILYYDYSRGPYGGTTIAYHSERGQKNKKAASLSILGMRAKKPGFLKVLNRKGEKDDDPMAGRIGELKVKPVAPSNLVPEQMPHESPKRRGQSGHHSIGNPTHKVEVNSDDSSSSFHLEAAVTTNAGCDDSNAFVQFTLGVEKPTSDSTKNSMNLGAVQEEKEEKEKMGTVDLHSFPKP